MNTKIVLSILTAGLLIGCGGGGGSSGNNGSSSSRGMSISGNVINGPIQGAIVLLECGSNVYRSTSVTTDQGTFRIKNIPTSLNLSECTLVAKNGTDTTDGTNLLGLAIKSPYKLFNNDTNLLITPITNLVAENNSSDIETAKQEVASFLGGGITPEDLTKNHLNIEKLKKKAKELTTIATKRDSNGDLIGYMDMDGKISNPKNYTDMSDYITQSDIEEKDDLISEINSIESASDINDIIKNPIIVSTYAKLKRFFNITSGENDNLRFLAEEITDSLKIVYKGEVSYKRVNRYHVRKALSDIDLYPEFKEDGSLTDEIANLINGDLATFKATVETNKIDTKSVEGLTLFNSKEYEQILGDNNNSRINYFMFSDKSHISKALSLIKNTFDDSVLNPSYVSISNGFARAGLYEEAIKTLNENIFGANYKISAYDNLAGVLIQDKKFARAEETLDKVFVNLIKFTDAKKAENLSIDDSALYINLFYKYYQINKASKGEEVLTYYQENVVPKLTTSNSYSRLVVSYVNIIRDLIEDNKIADAKILYDKAVNYVKSIPHSSSTLKSTMFNIMEVAHLGPMLKENSKTTELINLIKQLDIQYNTGYAPITSVGYTGSIKGYAANAGRMAAITALNGDLTNVLDKLENGGIIAKKDYGVIELEEEQNDTALSNGIIAQMFIENKNKEAIDLLYKYRPFKDYEDTQGNQIYRIYIPRDFTSSPDTPRILKAYNPAKMAEFFDALISDMDNRPWKLTDRSIAANVIRDKSGLTIAAKHYNDVNEFAKRDALINKTINIANGMTDEVYKLNVYQTIIDAVNSLKMKKTPEIEALVNNLKTLVDNVRLDNTSDEYLVQLRTVIKLSKNLAKYTSLEEARTLINTAVSSLPANESGNLTKIKQRTKYALGEINANNTDLFSESILSGLIETKQLDKAEILIDEIQNNILTLPENSLDSFSLLRVVVSAYASIGNIEKVNSSLLKIKTFKERNQSILKAVRYFSRNDSFIKTPFAFIDTDSDGKPDFFKKGISAEQIASTGLTLDEDIDGDGILDTVDKLPYSKEN